MRRAWGIHLSPGGRGRVGHCDPVLWGRGAVPGYVPTLGRERGGEAKEAKVSRAGSQAEKAFVCQGYGLVLPFLSAVLFLHPPPHQLQAKGARAPLRGIGAGSLGSFLANWISQ